SSGAVVILGNGGSALVRRRIQTPSVATVSGVVQGPGGSSSELPGPPACFLNSSPRLRFAALFWLEGGGSHRARSLRGRAAPVTPGAAKGVVRLARNASERAFNGEDQGGDQRLRADRAELLPRGARARRRL